MLTFNMLKLVQNSYLLLKHFNASMNNNNKIFFSAEKLFVEMAKLGQNALFPLVVVDGYFISIRNEFFEEERCMYNLLQNTNG